jgi:hypothetical protein
VVQKERYTCPVLSLKNSNYKHDEGSVRTVFLAGFLEAFKKAIHLIVVPHEVKIKGVLFKGENQPLPEMQAAFVNAGAQGA